MPTMIAIVGTIERMLGENSAAANMALAGWAMIQMAVGFVLTIALFRRLGAGRTVRRAGSASFVCCQSYIVQEAADFRVWEGALAYDLAAANLLWLTVLGERHAVAVGDLAIAAIGSALAFFVGPTAGLAVYAAWALFASTRLPVGQIVRWAALTALAIAALVHAMGAARSGAARRAHPATL